MYYLNLIKDILSSCRALLKVDNALAIEILDNMGEYRLSAMTKQDITKAVISTLVALGY
jgi:hypothetical protein